MVAARDPSAECVCETVSSAPQHAFPGGKCEADPRMLGRQLFVLVCMGDTWCFIRQSEIA